LIPKEGSFLGKHSVLLLKKDHLLDVWREKLPQDFQMNSIFQKNKKINLLNTNKCPNLFFRKKSSNQALSFMPQFLIPKRAYLFAN